MKPEVKLYLAKIGSKGGKVSRRTLSREQAQEMVRLRIAKKAYRDFYARCFWSFDKDYVVKKSDLPWISEKLMTYGGHRGYLIGMKLCH